LETLPKEIARLSAEIERLSAQLADPAFYTRDPKAFAAASDKLDAAETAKTKAENDWLELELLREEIEG
jgi:ATP-binding cassette subfamily F protein uup